MYGAEHGIGLLFEEYRNDTDEKEGMLKEGANGTYAFRPEAVASGIYMDKDLLSIKTLNKLRFATSTIRDQATAYQKQRTPSTLTSDQVFVPGEITWRADHSQYSQELKCLTGTFRATVGCGVIPMSLDYSLTLTDLDGTPIADPAGNTFPTLYTDIADIPGRLDDMEKNPAKYRRGNGFGFERPEGAWTEITWSWDEERYYQDPGQEVLDMQQGKYTVIGKVTVFPNRYLPGSKKLSEQEKILWRSHLTDPKKTKPTLKFMRIKQGPLTWQLTPPGASTTTAPKAP